MDKSLELLRECNLQLEYLSDKFGETGTGNALLTKLYVYFEEHDPDNAVKPNRIKSRPLLPMSKEKENEIIDKAKKYWDNGEKIKAVQKSNEVFNNLRTAKEYCEKNF